MPEASIQVTPPLTVHSWFRKQSTMREEQSCLRSALTRMTCRRAICYLTTAAFAFLFFTVYITYFRHPPPDVLLQMNLQKQGGAGPRGTGGLEGKGGTRALEEKLKGRKVREKGAEKWERFLKKNNYVCIGQVYDKCDEDEREMVGTVMMLSDEETGGVKSRTIMNATMEEEVTGGQFFIEVKYNGRELYDNHWDLCTLDEDEEERQIICPISEGLHHYSTDSKIPSYLPKGQYEAKVWITNQDESIIGCGFADFVL